MKITDIALTKLVGKTSLTFPPGDRQAQMLDIYPEFNAQNWANNRGNSPRQVQAIYVEIHTDAGVSGIFGPIEEEQAFVIRKFLRPFLCGRDPLATELLHDQMLRMHRHGRSGLFMTGISSIDCALWDLKGKNWNAPVYRLLGGPTRHAIPAYASMLAYSVEPEEATQVALEYKAAGFSAQKWFFRYGPGDGEVGKIKNAALAKALREALGPFYILMFDAYMGWDRVYATEMMRAIEPYRLTWLEEPLPPERVGSFTSLKTSTRVPIATGEHVYTRWQVKELLAANAVDFVQADPDWTGGITELVKICALASAYDTPIVAHGHSLLPALHVAAAQSPSIVPMVEYLIQHQTDKQFFHQTIYQPENGAIKIPDLPGLGLVLDGTKIESREDY